MAAGRTPSFGGLTRTPLLTTAGLVALYDAAHGVELNGGNVASLADIKNGNTVSQGTPSAQMAFISSWRNGMPALQCASGDLLIRSTWIGGSVSQPTTIYLVGENSSVESIASGVYLSAGAAFHCPRVISGVPSALCTGNASISGTVTNSAAFISRWNMNGASTSIRVEQHGLALLSGTCDPGNTVMNGIAIGGNYDNTFNPLIKLSLVAVFSGVVGAADEARILSYARSRYNIIGA